MNRYFCEGSTVDTKENLEYTKSINSLEKAMLTKTVLEQRALVFDTDKNLVVNLGSVKGVIPYYECALGLDDGTARDISVISRVGKPVCFIVTGFDYDSCGNRIAILSRRFVQQQCLENYISALRIGDIIDCKVTHLESFGCFCDVGCGISALLPIDYISVSRISHPRERIYVGMDLKCAIKSIDEHGRLLLTHKELLGSWEENSALFKPGETVFGMVRSIEDYGVFVELTPNLAGLAEPCDKARLSCGASVYIKSIIPERMKIKLIIIDCFEPETHSIANFSYFFNQSHIDEFQYSPANCAKRVESIFISG
ncbi:MAG: S1 RNA-binding domain-containing protein [Oscillospiraceae bacterium]